MDSNSGVGAPSSSISSRKRIPPSTCATTLPEYDGNIDRSMRCGIPPESMAKIAMSVFQGRYAAVRRSVRSVIF